MKKEFGGNLLKFLFFLACSYGIVRISIWSYIQTQLFFVPFDVDSGSSVISNGLALISQYGQNVALFLCTIEAGRRLAYKNKISSIQGNKAHVAILQEEIYKSQTTSNLYYILFGVFALIDSGTNLGQFESTTLLVAKSTLAGFPLTMFTWVGRAVSIVVVFVEELFMDTANALLHAFNDLLESMGMRRLPSLDLFVDPDKILATRLDERNGKQGQTQQVKTQSAPSYGDVQNFLKQKQVQPKHTPQFQGRQDLNTTFHKLDNKRTKGG